MKVENIIKDLESVNGLGNVKLLNTKNKQLIAESRTVRVSMANDL